MPQITKKCKICEKIFSFFPSRRQKFCSLSCSFKKGKRKPICLKVCEGCKRTFEVYPYRKSSARFCSRRCLGSVLIKKFWKNSSYRKKVINSRKWYKHSKETKEKLSIYRKNNPVIVSGKNHWSWKGGISSLPGYNSFLTRRRRYRKRVNGGSHSFEEWMFLKKINRFTCLRCKKREPEIKLTEDHITPVSKGGSDNIENIQPLCRSCNSMKNNKEIKYAMVL